jgi:hypothetical protein
VKENLMSTLKVNKLYALLINIQYFDSETGNIRTITPIKSMIITGNSNVKLIGGNLKNGLIQALYEYNITDGVTIVTTHWRDWLKDEDYSNLVNARKRTKIVNEVLKDESVLGLDKQSKFNQILKIIKMVTDNHYLNDFPKFDSITKLDVYCDSDSGYRDVEVSYYKLLLFLKDLVNNNQDLTSITVYKGVADSTVDPSTSSTASSTESTDQGENIELYFAFNLGSKKRVICLADSKSWQSSLIYWNNYKYPYPK